MEDKTKKNENQYSAHINENILQPCQSAKTGSTAPAGARMVMSGLDRRKEAWMTDTCIPIFSECLKKGTRDQQRGANISLIDQVQINVFNYF
jgi:hypothetical protein